MKSESEVAQSCPTLSDPIDCSLPGSSVRGIFQARVLEWGAIAFSSKKRGARGLKSGDDDGGKWCYIMWESQGKPDQYKMMFDQIAEGIP